MPAIFVTRVLLFITFPATIVPLVAAEEGFGAIKQTVTLHRKLPPVFQLNGTAVNVVATPSAPGSNPLADELVTLIETGLQHNDNRVTIQTKSPQTVITCKITSYEPPKFQDVPPASKNKVLNRTKTTKVTAAVKVAYNAEETGGKTLDADVIEAKVDDVFEAAQKSGAFGISIPLPKTGGAKDSIPSAEEVNQMLLKQLVSKIVPRIVTTDESIQVLLAKGSLSEADKLGESGLWPRMLDATEAVPPFSKPEDEAYRLYNIGVAYEAMGYQAEDKQQALKLFEQAAVNYGKAIDDKPSEKYFREPQNRIEEAMLILKTLEKRNETPGPVPPPSDALTNTQVIELAKSGLNEANQIEAIKSATAVNFDLSATGLVQLLKGGVSNNVIAAMRQKANATKH